MPRRTTSLFAAPRPAIPGLRKLTVDPIKSTPNLATSRPITDIASMEIPLLDPIRSHMTCSEFTDSVWGFIVSGHIFLPWRPTLLFLEADIVF